MSLTKNDLNQIKELILESELRLEARFERKFATKDDLKNFATKDDLKNFPTKADLAAALEGYTTKEDLKNYPTKTDLSIALEGFVTKKEFFYQTNRIINMLEEILTVRDYVTRAEFEDRVLDVEDRIDTLEKSTNRKTVMLLSDKHYKNKDKKQTPKPLS